MCVPFIHCVPLLHYLQIVLEVREATHEGWHAATTLSGGQQTLLAIAFVLATFTFRPVPYILLDEIDAALDETNQGRLGTLVTQLLQESSSQAIAVSHLPAFLSAASKRLHVTKTAGDATFAAS